MTRNTAHLPQRTANKVVEEYRRIRAEYAWDPSIFSTEDPRVAVVKEIIETRLTPADRTIFLLYADCQSLRVLGKKMGTSHMTMRKEIQRIKGIILGYYKEAQA